MSMGNESKNANSSQNDEVSGNSWMSIEQAKAAYPNVFTSEGRPEGQYEVMLDFLIEMDCVIAPINKPETGTPPSPQP